MEVALIILFNHKFERNLPRLRQIYSDRFSNLYFIMPFYKGNDPDVICVYENSFYFQGYIAQALQRIKRDGIDHYMVIGDDLILNPDINEKNYAEHFKLGPDDGFIPEIFLLDDEVTPRRLMRKATHWFWNLNAVNFRLEQGGIEVKGELPAYETAKEILKSHGYNFNELLNKESLAVNYPKWGAENVNDVKTYVTHIANCFIRNHKLSNKERRTMHYPMVGSYSDIVIIPGNAVDTFSNYAGVMAALNLFVEIALPTALLLSVKKVTQEKDLAEKGYTIWESYETKKMEDEHNNNLDSLFENFPTNTLYIHPVKLSKWK